MGFVQSNFDPCVFIKKNMIILSYVDDYLIFTQDKKLIINLIKELAKEFKFNNKGLVSNYLGMKIATLGREIELK